MQAKPTVSLRISEKHAITDLNFAFVAEQFIAPPDKSTRKRQLAFPRLSMSKLRSIYSLITNIHARVNTPEELEAKLKEIIARVGATSGKDMGKVMGVASKKLAGLAEGRAISAKVKELLG